ncbi:MobA/MobL family protein [Luteibacter sahnii]|uniref:MobA/MobL family protein n=1 Tax=Luteibacter sahnii TaxID=3021977 RepID=UPI002A6AACD8|nr:MobA/MobL family protein [Luteibacter sp. PPL193]MDY1548547.1 MobA/MobL family protein [Luteibacter sp. PPL193]
MTHHARPHLTTHTRSKGHSAVAGVAYRLGLRLQDRRTGEWHDYRRREAGAEIVATLTVAPVGAPAWVLDPQTAWTEVEAAERRKDSQLAHDFRLPIPFGVSDADALAMARRVAQRICDDLHTFVSIGLHRDSTVDAMGIAKPHDRVGIHAHLYFPTRRLVFQADASSGDGNSEGETGEGTWVLGDKLRVLSTKATAAACIERFNAAWAEAANEFAAAAGQVPDFSHLSYARLGLSKIPQLTLGAAATAMERRGERSWKGDLARAGAPSPAATVVPSPTAGAVERLAARRAAASPGTRAWLNPAEPIVMRPHSPSESKAVEFSANGLAARFFAELDRKPDLPRPTPEQRTDLIGWLNRIEKTLRTLARAVARLLSLKDNRNRDDVARATFAVELDDRRRRREEARQAVAAWLASHPWRLRLVQTVSASHRKPGALVEREGRVAAIHREVQQLKRGADDAVGRVAEWDARIALAAEELDTAQAGLTAAAQRVCGLDPLYGMVLLSVAEPEHLPRLSLTIPETPAGPTSEDGMTAPLKAGESLALRPSELHRPRPAI